MGRAMRDGVRLQSTTRTHRSRQTAVIHALVTSFSAGNANACGTRAIASQFPDLWWHRSRGRFVGTDQILRASQSV